MIEQILSNNNERYYSNFSPTFHEVNTPYVNKLLRTTGSSLEALAYSPNPVYLS
jgi:hypothetical protein